jgi:hypothetical protein
MTISLAFLAPDLVKAAIAGRLPHGMGVSRLADMPAEWCVQDEDGQHILQNIRVLRERFEPDVVAKEKASRPQQAKVGKGAYRARAAGASWQMPLQQ